MSGQMNTIVKLMNELNSALKTRDDAVYDSEILAREVLASPKLSALLQETKNKNTVADEINFEKNLRYQTADHAKDESLYMLDHVKDFAAELRSSVKEIILATEDQKSVQSQEYEEHINYLKAEYANAQNKNQELRFKLQKKLATLAAINERINNSKDGS